MREDFPQLIRNQVAGLYRAIDGKFDPDADGLCITERADSSVVIGFRGLLIGEYTGVVDQYHLAACIRRSLRVNLETYLSGIVDLLHAELRLPAGVELDFSVEEEMRFFDLAASTTHAFLLHDTEGYGLRGEVRLHTHTAGATLSLQADVGGTEHELITAKELTVVNRTTSGLVREIVKRLHAGFARLYSLRKTAEGVSLRSVA